MNKSKKIYSQVLIKRPKETHTEKNDLDQYYSTSDDSMLNKGGTFP